MNDSQHLTLSDFLNAEMDKRKMSMREFARAVGVDQSAISKLTSPEPPTPTLKVLFKLAEGTGANLITLMKISYPDMPIDVPDIEAQLITDRIMRLDGPERTVVENLVISLVEKELNKKK